MSRIGEPAFSIVIPCRNEADTLAACLDALRRQDYPRDRYEVLVVDGHSTDGSHSLARHAGVRLLKDHGTGPSGARNLGIRHARAPIVAFTDADCVPARDWLTRYAEAFAEDPSLAGVAGAMRMTSGTTLGLIEDVDALANYRGFITSNVAYRRDVLLHVGGFAEDLCCAEDYDLAWRVMDAGHKVVHDPRPVVVHHPPEVSGSLARYLRKQAWYARNDVPAYVRAILRARKDPSAHGSTSAALAFGPSLRDAFWVAAVGGGLAAGSPAVAGAGLAGATLVSARQAWRNARAVDAEPGLVPRMAAVCAAKSFARGFGTLVGLAELARPSRWRLLRPPGAVSLGPSPPARERPWPARAASRA